MKFNQIKRQITPTPLSNKRVLVVPDEMPDKYLESVTQFINQMRDAVSVNNPDRLKSRLELRSAEDLIEELDFVASNVLACEPYPYAIGIIMGPIEDLGGDPAFQWDSINIRDRKKAANGFLQNMREAFGVLQIQQAPDAQYAKSLAIGVAQFQHYFHHLPSGNDRLGRVMAMIYWPGDFKWTTDQVGRAFANRKDPRISHFENPELSVATHIVSKTFGFKHDGKELVVPGEFSQGAEALWGSELGSLMRHESGQHKEFMMNLLRDAFAALGYPRNMLDRNFDNPLPRSRQGQLTTVGGDAEQNRISDIHELFICKGYSLLGLYVSNQMTRTLESLDGGVLPNPDIFQFFAELSRQARLDVLDLATSTLADQTLMMTLPNGQEVAMGDVLRLQFEDGMDWLAGTFEREDVDGSRPWLSEAPAEIQLTIEVAPISERLSGLTVERFDPDPRDFMP